RDLLTILAVDGEVLVGTSPDAKVLKRSKTKPEGVLVHDFAGDEVRALALTKTGLVAAVNDFTGGDVSSVQNLTSQLDRASLTGEAPVTSSLEPAPIKASASLLHVDLEVKGKRDLARATDAPWESWLE